MNSWMMHSMCSMKFLKRTPLRSSSTLLQRLLNNQGTNDAGSSESDDSKPFRINRAQQTNLQLLSAFYLSRPLLNICKAPLARLTMLSQVQGMYSNFGVMSKPSLSRIIKEEGFKSLWKGNLARIARRPPCFAISMLTSAALYTYAEEYYDSGIPAMLSTIVATSAIYPMDLVRTRLAAQGSSRYYNGIWHALRTICREEGFLGLYKGNGASILRKLPKQAIYVSSWELIHFYWACRRPDDSSAIRIAGSLGLCGFISSMATFPRDVVRRRLQLDGAGGQARIYNTGFSGTFKQIVQTEGWRGLYSGSLPNFLKMVPRAGLFFIIYEMLSKNYVFSFMVSDESFFDDN